MQYKRHYNGSDADEAMRRTISEDADCTRRWSHSKPVPMRLAIPWVATRRGTPARQRGTLNLSMPTRHDATREYRNAVKHADALMARGLHKEAYLAYNDAARIAPTRHKRDEAAKKAKIAQYNRSAEVFA